MGAPRQAVLLFEERAAKNVSPAIRGGKGAKLSEMAALKLPVPPGFTIGTTVSRAFYETGRLPRRVNAQIDRSMKALEAATGKVYGDPNSPLLLSVRSGAAVSMPGMMDTILNVGLNSESMRGLTRFGGKKFAADCMQRLHDSFSESVGTKPNDPMHQLYSAIEAVLRSWWSDRARAYRNAHGIPDRIGTAVNIQAMVFGNLDDRSGTGVVFSHDISTGRRGLYGEFLINAQGEDLVSGKRTPRPIQEMRNSMPELYEELETHVMRLSDQMNDIADIEFTVESGKLYLLQSRAAKRSPLASVTFAVQQVWARKWTREEATVKVGSEAVSALSAKTFEQDLNEEELKKLLLATGLPASPGAAVGIVTFNSSEAIKLAAQGLYVVLVRPQTSPEDLEGMMVSSAILTLTGGATSHAALVARELGIPAVVGIGNLPGIRRLMSISVDGSAGSVFRGALTLTKSERTKEVNIFFRWTKAARPKLDASLSNQWWSVNQLLTNFYLSDAMAHEAIGTRMADEASELRDQIHRHTAEIFATYLLYAVTREVRHYWDGKTGKNKQSERLARSLLKLSPAGDPSSWHLPKLLFSFSGMKQDALVKHVELIEALFVTARWQHSIGGKAWAAIARALLHYLTGKLTPSLFADHVFDLRHNGGVLFNKHEMVSTHTDEQKLRRQLDTKRDKRTVAELYSELPVSPRYFYFGTGISHEVEELYKSGKTQELW